MTTPADRKYVNDRRRVDEMLHQASTELSVCHAIIKALVAKHGGSVTLTKEELTEEHRDLMNEDLDNAMRLSLVLPVVEEESTP